MEMIRRSRNSIAYYFSLNILNILVSNARNLSAIYSQFSLVLSSNLFKFSMLELSTIFMFTFILSTSSTDTFSWLDVEVKGLDCLC